MQEPRHRPDRPDPAGEFPLDATAYIFHLFSVATRHREARLDEQLRPLDLNVPRYIVLGMVNRFEPCSMTHLAEYSAVDRTTLTRMIDQLVRSGLVERATPPSDRRQVLLSLTDRGRKILERSRQIVDQLNSELVRTLSDSERRAIARGFRQIVANLADEPALLRRLLLEEDA